MHNFKTGKICFYDEVVLQVFKYKDSLIFILHGGRMLTILTYRCKWCKFLQKLLTFKVKVEIIFLMYKQLQLINCNTDWWPDVNLLKKNVKICCEVHNWNKYIYLNF